MGSRKILTIALLTLPLILIVGVLVSVSICNYNLKQRVNVESSKLEQANAQLEQRNYTKARRLFSDLIMINDQNLEAVLGMNSIYMLYADYSDSQSLLINYVANNDSRVFLALAKTYFGLHDFNNAAHYAKMSLTVDPLSEDSLSIYLEAINVTFDKDSLSSWLGTVNIKDYSYDSQFLVTVTELNFGLDKLSEMNSLEPNLSDANKKIAAVYDKYFAATAVSSSEMEAKANIIYALLANNYYFYAYPFTQDIYSLNKYYENAAISHSIIEIKLGDYKNAITAMELALNYYPNSINAKILLLESYLGAGESAKGQNLVQSLVLSYASDNEAKYFEALKLLYSYHYYDLYLNMFWGVASKMKNNTTAIYYMAMQSCVYKGDRSLLPMIIDKVADGENILNVFERANYDAAQALVAYDQTDQTKADSLIGTAEELYFYSPFVQYVKSVINNDQTYLDRAFELDITHEIPVSVVKINN